MPAVNISTSTVSFPSSTLAEHPGPASPSPTGHHSLPNISSESSFARTSRSSLRASALEAHDMIWLAEPTGNVARRLNRLYESNAVYKNTFVTATSLSTIIDLHSLTRRVCHLQVPTPTTLVTRLFGHEGNGGGYWVACRIWSDIENVCETESFDGHRKSIIEHTVHLVLLDGLIHRSVRVHTSLSFNEQNKITHHQDICDARELLYLIPGGRFIQSLTTRFTAIGLAGLSRVTTTLVRSTSSMWPYADPENVDGRKTSASGRDDLVGYPRSQDQYSHAPDTDAA